MSDSTKNKQLNDYCCPRCPLFGGSTVLRIYSECKEILQEMPNDMIYSYRSSKLILVLKSEIGSSGESVTMINRNIDYIHLLTGQTMCSPR